MLKNIFRPLAYGVASGVVIMELSAAWSALLLPYDASAVPLRAPDVALSEAFAREKGMRLVARDPHADNVAMVEWSYAQSPRHAAEYARRLKAHIEARCSGTINNCRPHVREYALTLYRAHRPSAAYVRWSAARRGIFVDLAAVDPLLMHAREHWSKPAHDKNHIGLERRKNAFLRISELYVQAFSGEGVRFEQPGLVIEPPTRDDAAGQYNWSLHIMRVAPGYLTKTTFSEIADTAVHETRHAVQRGIALLLGSERGLQYLRRHGIEDDARIFELVFGAARLHYTTLTEDAYLFSPLEKDANDAAKDAAVVGAGPLFQSTRHIFINGHFARETAWRTKAAARFSLQALPR